MLASGRNVCVHFLFGDCRFGSCVYSHDKTYLPSGRWWDDEQKRGAIRSISKGLIRGQNPAFLHRIFASIDDRIAWSHPAEMEDESTFWSENIAMLQYFGGEVDDDWLDSEYTAHRNRRRGSRGGQGRDRGRGRPENWGFTDDEVQELICQGVKPWDDDASVSVKHLAFFFLLSDFRVRMSWTYSTCSDQKTDFMRFVSI